MNTCPNQLYRSLSPPLSFSLCSMPSLLCSAHTSNHSYPHCLRHVIACAVSLLHNIHESQHVSQHVSLLRPCNPLLYPLCAVFTPVVADLLAIQNLTFMVPTDKVWAKRLPYVNRLTKAQKQQLIGYHILNGDYPSATLVQAPYNTQVCTVCTLCTVVLSSQSTYSSMYSMYSGMYSMYSGLLVSRGSPL